VKLKIRDTYQFSEGMKCGAVDFALSSNDANKAMRPTSKWRQYDYGAFINGYNLANSEKYYGAYKAGRNLLFVAVNYGDIFPVEWKIGGNVDGNYIDEIE